MLNNLPLRLKKVPYYGSEVTPVLQTVFSSIVSPSNTPDSSDHNLVVLEQIKHHIEQGVLQNQVSMNLDIGV